ncbi:patatin-like phospholipase family protein [Pseudonocardia sp.]|uniref:patatin-like phospholipase family protein n=1 Tax=Pseudonocardia sp. TaxID=60912 RepID=UPI003D09D4A9
MQERVGLVLAGAAARGPYQAGALSVLVPALRAAGHEPVVILGTSSGAINAALLAQFADTGDEAGAHVADVWARFGPVFTNPLYTASTLRLLGRTLVAGTPAEELVGPAAALLDTAPLHRRAAELFDGGRVAGNVAAGRPRTLAVAATTCPTGGAAARSRLFVHGEPLPAELTDPAVDVVPVATMSIEYLLASAAIPVLFPPEYVSEPADVRGWYVDGGVRLNAPLGAALAAGVTRVVVVSGHSAAVPPRPEPVDPGTRPDMAASTAVSLRAVLADALTDDLQALGRRNREAERGYRTVPYLLVAPEDGVLARIAAEVFRPSILPPDAFWAIGRILDVLGDGPGRDELLSLVLFDPEYAEQQLTLGRVHAQQALAAGWRLDPPGAPR